MGLKRKDVEAYLRNNPEFTRDWFTHEVSPQQREEWENSANLMSIPVPIDAISETLSSLGDQEHHEETDSSAVARAVPRRNSITSNMFRDLVQGKRTTRKVTRKNKSELQAMSEREVFMELIRDIASEMDVNILCHKILLNVSILTKSDRGSLFLMRGSKDKRFLVSKLFDVTEHSSMKDSLHTEENQIRVPLGKGIAGHVALTKETVNIKNAYEVSFSFGFTFH